MSRPLLAMAVTLFSWCSLFAQNEIDSVTDSARIEITDTVRADTAAISLGGTINDSIRVAFPKVNPDTLTANQRLLVEFETRFVLRQREAPRVEVKDRFSYYDSLAAYYVSPRWNLREDIDRSFYHDAGDYFRSDPNFVVFEAQTTPMRKTVRPFGFSGDRLGLIRDGRSVRPFEHVVEPDGLVDMNDLPTALDHTVAIMPGPAGMIFGADHSVASLLTMPMKPDSTNPRSCFLVDKGAFAYSHARGRYSKNFLDGRHIDMSIEYRKSDGVLTGRADDAYHYTGSFLVPLNERWAVEADGRLYDRKGDYPVLFSLENTVGVTRLKRYRFDRAAHVVVSRQNEGNDGRYLIGYRHLRQGSDLDGAYNSNLDQTGHGFDIGREWLSGETVMQAGLGGDYLEYNSWYEQHTRLSGSAFMDIARLSRPWGMAATARVVHVESFGFLPSVAALIRKERARSNFSFSVGYSERAPHFYELYLPSQNARMYGSGTIDYSESGNSLLVSEKMLQGSMEMSLGQPDKSLTVSSSGGEIWDGIDWAPQTNGDRLTFAPSNTDIKWSNVSLTGRLRLADFLRFKGGGSYHYLDHGDNDGQAYAPEYQAFSGLELHLFWRQKLIDFRAYGEMVYVGPYDGLRQADLGNNAIFNVKLSFRMGNFRFHWIMQNALSTAYYSREYWLNQGYVVYYGFTWDFFE